MSQKNARLRLEAYNFSLGAAMGTCRAIFGFLRFSAFICTCPNLAGQPWQCYQTANRRMRKLGQPEFPMAGLSRRGPGIDEEILAMCIERGMEVVKEFGQTKWQRRVVLLARERS